MGAKITWFQPLVDVKVGEALGLLAALEWMWELDFQQVALLGKTKLGREISDGKNKIPHKFFGRKI